MKAEIVGQPNSESKTFADIRKGQLAVITDNEQLWACGLVVTRDQDGGIVSLGRKAYRWTNCDTMIVRILEPGEQVLLTQE